MPELLPAAAEVLWQSSQTGTVSTLQGVSMAAALVSSFHALLCRNCSCQILPSFYLQSQQRHTKPQSIQHNKYMPANEINNSMDRTSNTVNACRQCIRHQHGQQQLFEGSQGGCCLCAGQSVMSAAPVGGTMAAGALLVLDSASQPHCLWPNRAPMAPEVSPLHEHQTDAVLLTFRCGTIQIPNNHMLCLFGSPEHMPRKPVSQCEPSFQAR